MFEYAGMISLGSSCLMAPKITANSVSQQQGRKSLEASKCHLRLVEPQENAFTEPLRENIARLDARLAHHSALIGAPERLLHIKEIKVFERSGRLKNGFFHGQSLQ